MTQTKKKSGIIAKLLTFITNDIWSINIKKLSSGQSFLIRLVRVIILAVRGFNEDRCIEKASALTYYTLFSLVPIAAMAFGIAKGFGFDAYLEEYLTQKFHDKQELLKQILEFSNSMLANARGGVIAGIGIVVLLWSVIKVLGNIESSFNEIWAVNKQRTFVRKISDYLTIMLLAPIFIIISSSATSQISLYITSLQKTVPWVSEVYGLISIALNLLPYSLIWLAFAFLYIVMPNTKVSFKSAFLGGVIAGIVFQVIQYFYIKFQVGVTSYNAIYGSFAAIPLFLFWMQLSWIIVLMGAEIAYATQNVKNFEFEVETKQLSHSLKMKLSLWVMHRIVLDFEQGLPPQTSEQLSNSLDIPHRITKMILNILLDAHLIHETKTGD
ncbi:MAG TPA: YihY/virulence factor BrkB family protein, partial [Bacteroidales bacterium]|nr:YihY/virulence factor BrkB family protein [Bacteroidales bacterium]